MLTPEEWRTFWSYLQRVRQLNSCIGNFLSRPALPASQTQHGNLLPISIVDTVIIDEEHEMSLWLFTGKVSTENNPRSLTLPPPSPLQDGRVLKKNAEKRNVHTYFLLSLIWSVCSLPSLGFLVAGSDPQKNLQPTSRPGPEQLLRHCGDRTMQCVRPPRIRHSTFPHHSLRLLNGTGFLSFLDPTLTLPFVMTLASHALLQ